MAINVTNITNFPELIQYANESSEGYFCVGILISLWTIIVIGLSSRGAWKEGTAAASFITLLVAILMRALSLIPDYVVMVCVVVFFGSLVMFFTSPNE